MIISAENCFTFPPMEFSFCTSTQHITHKRIVICGRKETEKDAEELEKMGILTEHS